MSQVPGEVQRGVWSVALVVAPGKQRQAELGEFKISLVDIVSIIIINQELATERGQGTRDLRGRKMNGESRLSHAAKNTSQRYRQNIS